MKSFALLSLSVVGILYTAMARPVTESEAATAAANWLRRNPQPAGVPMAAASAAAARASLDDDGEPLFHVATFGGGGALVLSADTSIMPVIAIVEANDLDEIPGNPLYEILVADMSSRLAQLRGTGTGISRKAMSCAASQPVRPAEADEAEAAWAALLEDGRVKRGVPAVRDVRVEPLLSTKWGQETDAAGRVCANYWTPRNYPCGCVALAGAQVARFWRYPSTACPQITRPCRVNGYRQTLTSKGGIYDWDSMPDKFDVLSSAQREAVGRLCYDFGVAARMDYAPGGSGSWGCLLGDAFLEVLGYASAKIYGISSDVFSDDIVERAILANLDAGCPVVLGIDGHEINADGYGFVSGVLYTHLNLGWEGTCNAWYNLPSIDADARGYYSTILDEAVYNIFPEWDGELLTGRVLDAAGNPLDGAAVVAECGSGTVSSTAGPHGIYALLVEGGRTWTVVASAGGVSSDPLEVFVAQSVSTTVRGEHISYDTGAVGNSWGNDLAVPVAPSDALLSSALDTDLDVATDGDAPWLSQTAEATEGLSAAQSGDVPPGGESRLFATVSGHGEISFWWKGVDANGSGVIAFLVDGEERDSITGGTGWLFASFAIEGDGEHLLEWIYANDDGNGGCGYLDCVAWMPNASRLEELRKAVDNHVLSFSTGGDAEWTRTTEEGFVGGDSACSGPVHEGETTWMEAAGAIGEGVISFRWKAAGAAGGIVRFAIDGEWKSGWPQTDGQWHHEAYRVGPGRHVFQWVCAKDDASDEGADYAWVDKVVWTPGTPLAPVFRFYSQNYRGHFFTMDEEEMTDIIEHNPNWRYEGVAFFTLPGASGRAVPLHRFYSSGYHSHFFTSDTAEYKTIRRTNPNWRYEGIASYVHAKLDEGTSPVYRFWSKTYRHHFFTIDKEERDVLIATNPAWSYEGTAFHAWAEPGDYDFSSNQ